MKNYAVVVCLHGDELFGLEVADKLSEEIPLFIGNPEAIKNKTRFLESDLNRVFPGDTKGNNEEKRAVYILNQLKNFRYIIDIHSSSSDTQLFGIITKPNKEKINLAKKLGLNKLVIMPEKFANGKALIDHVSCGISLEIGPHEKKEIVKDVIKALNNLNGKSNKESPSIYEITKIIFGENNAEFFIANFQEVSKGDLIAKGKKDYFAETDFTPIFVGEKAYNNILCLASKKINQKDNLYNQNNFIFLNFPSLRTYSKVKYSNCLIFCKNILFRL